MALKYDVISVDRQRRCVSWLMKRKIARHNYIVTDRRRRTHWWAFHTRKQNRFVRRLNLVSSDRRQLSTLSNRDRTQYNRIVNKMSAIRQLLLLQHLYDQCKFGAQGITCGPRAPDAQSGALITRLWSHYTTTRSGISVSTRDRKTAFRQEFIVG